jgi:hypothetical protein
LRRMVNIRAGHRCEICGVTKDPATRRGSKLTSDGTTTTSAPSRAWCDHRMSMIGPELL